MTPEDLLAEIEDLIRTRPDISALINSREESLAWAGRLSAVMRMWDPARSTTLNHSLRSVMADNMLSAPAYSEILMLLNEARFNLRMGTHGPLSVAVESSRVFEYFDEVRKVLEAATHEVFFVDRYLDAEFVSRYLPHIPSGVNTRLLTRERVSKLLPAVSVFASQEEAIIEVRTSAQIHDRFVFIDGTQCYQSGASFKDGAKRSPTTLTQITDAFDSVLATYEAIWTNANRQSLS